MMETIVEGSRNSTSTLGEQRWLGQQGQAQQEESLYSVSVMGVELCQKQDTETIVKQDGSIKELGKRVV